ncbi:hypothetical protein C8A03DRAFT_46621 [Achaetomium macrosporum]|uniref:Peptidase A1 domain-containing protein n=1 Tax=Achaetomium macrosporum TaxID=79813 RepID=A0AAN7C4Q1_9PEZI|nr:hypothetical protein C8A03DRAFT_46621 [Achaetomium macrosporum]
MRHNPASHLLWAFSCLAWSAAGRIYPYRAYDESVFIPFLDQTTPPWTRPVHMKMRVGSFLDRNYFEPVVDTGSTGIVLPGVAISNFDRAANCTPTNTGFHYLTSSNVLYQGCWVTEDVYFNEDNPTTATPVVHSRVPVLAVYRRIQCADTTDDLYVFAHGDCPDKVSDDPDPTGIALLGIGWGRIDDGKPGGTSDKNPLINVVDIPGVNTAKLYKGFIVTKDGIRVGLTELNTDNFDFVPLQRRDDGPPGGTPNWQQIPACIWFGSEVPGTSPCQTVSALLDTGVTESYLRTTTSGHMPPRVYPTTVVENDTPVTVSFWPTLSGWGLGGHPSEAFTVGVFPGGVHDVTPSSMRAYMRDGYAVPTFFNSGMHVFRKYHIAHDARDGKVGFKLWA